jgi:hypothetical protein
LISKDQSQLHIKKLIKETKRLIVAVLHVQTGNNLLETLEASVAPKEEAAFSEYVQGELEKASERAALTGGSEGNLSSDTSLSPVSPVSVDTLNIVSAASSIFVNSDGSR